MDRVLSNVPGCGLIPLPGSAKLHTVEQERMEPYVDRARMLIAHLCSGRAFILWSQEHGN